MGLEMGRSRQSGCWVLRAAAHSRNFPLGSMHSGHIDRFPAALVQIKRLCGLVIIVLHLGKAQNAAFHGDCLGSVREASSRRF